MMRVLILFLLIMPAIAAGSHHRDHAAGFIDSMISGMHFEITIWLMEQVDRQCELDSAQQKNLDVVIGYSEKMIRWLPSFRAQVLTSDLDIVRRKWSQPNAAGAQSVIHLLASTMHHLRQLSYQCGGDADIHVSSAITRISTAWSLADHVIWHINDAIREEIYGDSEFQ